MSTKRHCSKCKSTLDENNFYTYRTGEKTEMCKKCLTMHIDNYNPETYLWILEKMDVPYIPEEWNSLLQKAAEKANITHKPLTGMSVFGKYLSKMRLVQWKDYTWADTEKIKAQKEKHIMKDIIEGRSLSEEILEEMRQKGEISEAEFKTLSAEPEPAPVFNPYPTNNPYEIVPYVDIGLELTEEDKMEMALKWGRLYRPDQWVRLEQFYVEMQGSFDIQDAAREDTLKKLCKISLKMDEAIDENDIDTFQKLTRTYDMLSKSGKFTEAQNKEGDKSFVDSIGELVAFCEKEGGFIPKFDFSIPQDVVDRTIRDMNNYVHNLVTTDLGLGQQIEDHMRKMRIQAEIEEEEEDELKIEEDYTEAVLQDVDIQAFYEDQEEQRLEDAATLGGEMDGA